MRFVIQYSYIILFIFLRVLHQLFYFQNVPVCVDFFFMLDALSSPFRETIDVWLNAWGNRKYSFYCLRIERYLGVRRLHGLDGALSLAPIQLLFDISSK